MNRLKVDIDEKENEWFLQLRECLQVFGGLENIDIQVTQARDYTGWKVHITAIRNNAK